MTASGTATVQFKQFNQADGYSMGRRIIGILHFIAPTLHYYKPESILRLLNTSTWPDSFQEFLDELVNMCRESPERTFKFLECIISIKNPEAFELLKSPLVCITRMLQPLSKKLQDETRQQFIDGFNDTYIAMYTGKSRNHSSD
jgi:hypothetical protein